jgi:hypothetical protein
MCVALSDERTGLYLQLLLALGCADIFGSDCHGTRDHNLLSQIRDFPFRRLLRLAGLRWRYSTPPPHLGTNYIENTRLFIVAFVSVAAGTCLMNCCSETAAAQTPQKIPFFYYCVRVC